MARAGVEPATFRFSGGRSYQLSYLADGHEGARGARKTIPQGAFRPELGKARQHGTSTLVGPYDVRNAPPDLSGEAFLLRPRRDSNPRPPP